MIQKSYHHFQPPLSQVKFLLWHRKALNGQRIGMKIIIAQGTNSDGRTTDIHGFKVPMLIHSFPSFHPGSL